MALSLLSRIPVVGLIFTLANIAIAIYLGLKGHQLGWQNRRFEGGLPEYFAVQNAWLKWGVGLLIAGAVLGFIGGVVAGLAGLHGASPVASPSP